MAKAQSRVGYDYKETSSSDLFGYYSHTKGHPVPQLKTQNLMKVSKEVLINNLKDKKDLEVLINNDTRKKVNPKIYPFCSIGLISSTFGFQSGQGTGCLISPNIVLTCAHNVYNRTRKQQSSKVSFMPALNGLKGQQFRAIKIHYPQQYKDEKEGDEEIWDIALLELQFPIGQRYGWLGIDASWYRGCVGQVSICGYPGYTYFNDKEQQNIGIMYGSEGEVRSDNHDILRYQIPTTAGQSGSPIFFQKENEYFVIGVHTTGVTANNSYNLGVNIDDKRIKFWIQSIIGKIERKLDLWTSDFTLEDWQYLATANLKKLQVLKLHGDPIQPDAMRILTKGDWPVLNELDLQSNQLEPQAILQFAQGKWNQISSLILKENKFGEEGMKYLVKHDWRNLKNLDLQKCQLGPEGAKALSHGSWQQLTKLNLAHNEIETQGVAYLCDANWNNIEELDLGFNSCDKEFGKIISQAKWMQSLKSINLLCNSNISDEGVKDFILMSNLKNIEHLYLTSSGAGNQTALAIISKRLLNLKSLYFDIHGPYQDGLNALFSESWIKMESFAIHSSYFNDQIAKKVIPLKWPCLTYLSFSSTGLTEEGVKLLALRKWEKLQNLDISYIKMPLASKKYLKKLEIKNSFDKLVYIRTQ